MPGRRCRRRGEESASRSACLIVSGDEAAAEPGRPRPRAEQPKRVIVITMFQGLAAGWADLVLPRTSYLERDGHVSSTSKDASSGCAGRCIPPVPDELAWIAKLAERSRRRALALTRRSSSPSWRRIDLRRRPRSATIGERADARRRPRNAAPIDTGPAEPPRGPGEHFAGRSAAAVPPALLGPAVERVPELAVPAATSPRSSSRQHDAAQRADRERRDRVSVRSNGTSVDAARALEPRGSVRASPASPRTTHGDLHPQRERSRRVSDEPWWIALIKSAVIVINLVMACVRVH